MLALFNYYKPYLTKWTQKLFRDDEGQTMVEYVMLIVLVAVAVFIASPSITNAIMNVFTGTSSLLEGGFTGS
jgi:Flp pilus assembly pilin Flp